MPLDKFLGAEVVVVPTGIVVEYAPKHLVRTMRSNPGPGEGESFGDSFGVSSDGSAASLSGIGKWRSQPA